MRPLMIACLLAALPCVAAAAPTWQSISSEPGKRIEIDRTSLKRDGNTVLAVGRVVLEKELIDARSGLPYRVIEATTRYDCGQRSANTIKRAFKKNESDVIREQEIKGNDLPIRSGTLDDKVLREVCRPPKETPADLAKKANEAAGELKAANDALLKKEMAKPEKPEILKASEQAVPKDGETSLIPSIRPNLKAAAEAARAAAAAEGATPPVPTPAAKEVTKEPVKEAPKPAPPVDKPSIHAKPQTVIVRNQPTPTPPARKPRKAPAEEGYMLELKQPEPSSIHTHLPWDYDGISGPDNWSRLDPRNKLCSTGERQSPIDIKDGIRVDLEAIKFNYKPSTFRIIDNGRSVQVEIGESSISLTGKTYELVQFHFHRPSEEKVNGQRFDMVAHLVHRADDGQYAILAVLLERGNENPFIQTLWNHMPLEKHQPVSPPSTLIDLNSLLPPSGGYYAYMGSLTEPPCTEGVLWLVMKQPVQVSADQIAIFSRLYKNNARPIQNAGNRLIKESR